MSGLSEEDIILANKIADRIRELRIRATGDKQIDFVKEYNIEKQDISRWENYVSKDKETGKVKGRGITIYTVSKFCDAVGITLKDFFDHASFRK